MTLAGKRAPLWEHIDRALDERARRNELAEAFLELSTRPGDVAAVDWLLTMVCVAKNVRGLHRLRDVGDGRRCRIDLEAEWDAVLTKALDEDEPATQRFIHHTLEAERDRVERALAPFLSTRLLLDGWARAGLGELPSAVTPSSM